MLHNNLEMKSTGGHYLLVYCGALEDLVKMSKLGTEYHTDTFKARAIMKHLLHNFEGSFQDLNMVSTTRVAVKVIMRDYQGAFEDFSRSP